MYSCYKCGAAPNHSIKSLDVLKLFQCNDCGTVACINHREGMLGGKCSKCGSSRSTVVALRKGGKQGKDEVQVSAGGGGSAPAAGSGNVSISAGQLKDMQATRQEAIAEGLARIQAAAEARENAKLTAEEQAKKDALEKELAELFGDNNFVKSGVSSMMGSAKKKEESIFNLGAGFGNTDSANDVSSKKKATPKQEEVEEEVEEEDIAQAVSKMMSSKSFGSKVKKAVESEELDEEQLAELRKPEENAFVKKTKYISLVDSFNVKSNYRLKLDDAIALKHEAEEDIINTLAKEFNLEKDSIVLKLKVKNFIPLDNIDHLLNLQAEDLEAENISIITGVMAQKITFDMVSYVDQFANILPQKSYIKGIYASFANNPEYEFAEQKEINLQLLDMAQENDKVVYLGLDNCPISHWKEIFDEYDLTEIQFIYTDIIKTEEELNFIKENNIKILVRPDVDFKYYSSILADYNNFCLGSAFERIVNVTQGEKVANSSILAKLLKNMHDVDEILIEQLLNLQEND